MGRPGLLDGPTFASGEDQKPSSGLIPDISVLDSTQFATSRLHPLIRSFYENTGSWEMEVWAKWVWWARPLAQILVWSFSRRLEQLNLPIDPMETSLGVTSEVFHQSESDGVAWLRRFVASGRLVFAGVYGTTDTPTHRENLIKVWFPLPGGGLAVLLSPRNSGPGNELTLVSEGDAHGDPGAYLVVLSSDGKEGWVRRVPLPEQFHVYVDPKGTLRTDHVLRFMRFEMLRIHYKLAKVNRA